MISARAVAWVILTKITINCEEIQVRETLHCVVVHMQYVPKWLLRKGIVNNSLL